MEEGESLSVVSLLHYNMYTFVSSIIRLFVMNLRSKLSLTVLLIGVLLGGCNLIYEDLSECPQGIC